jgi:hypothetical protein
MPKARRRINPVNSAMTAITYKIASYWIIGVVIALALSTMFASQSRLPAPGTPNCWFGTLARPLDLWAVGGKPSLPVKEVLPLIPPTWLSPHGSDTSLCVEKRAGLGILATCVYLEPQVSLRPYNSAPDHAVCVYRCGWPFAAVQGAAFDAPRSLQNGLPLAALMTAGLRPPAPPLAATSVPRALVPTFDMALFSIGELGGHAVPVRILWTGVALNALFYIPPIWLVLSIPSRFLAALRRRRGHCGRCGYNLSGNITGLCPECGHAVPRPPTPDARTPE